MATIQVSILANVLLAVLKIYTCSGFLLNDGDTLSSLCFPQDQYCSCFDYLQTGKSIDVECIAQNLTQFPNFTKISDQIFGHYNDFTLWLMDNELTTIPSGVFWNFNRVNKIETSMFLQLDGNKISMIENGAFIGVNNMDIGINLTDNRLTALPLAFQLLHHINTLSLQRNPILTFDSATVNAMATSLEYLEIDYKALVLGYTELSVLKITDLTVNDIPSDYGNLAFNPFLLFRNSLSFIDIFGTELTTLPCISINGPRMKYFNVEYANISANNVFDCQSGTSLEVFDVGMFFCNLDEFPDILNLMPSLLGLSLIHNTISSINEKFIPLHNKLQVLNLSYNQLRTIPAVFNRFDHLKFLYIEYNQITFVAPESNLLSIKSLCVAGNPWVYNNTNCDVTYAYYEFMYLFINTTLNY